jgi:hypothetical protein
MYIIEFELFELARTNSAFEDIGEYDRETASVMDLKELSKELYKVMDDDSRQDFMCDFYGECKSLPIDGNNKFNANWLIELENFTMGFFLECMIENLSLAHARYEHDTAINFRGSL